MNNEIVLITGGSTGIGAAVANLAASEGARVAICDVNQSEGELLATSTGGRFYYCDVSQSESVSSAVQKCVSEIGVPKYVHLNAGIMTVPTGQPFLPIEEVAEEQYRKIVGVNLDGVYHGTKHLIPLMREAGGTITITASIAGLSNAPIDPMYTATKYAVIGFGRAVAAANEGSSINVNVICPGVVDTGIVPEEFKAPEFRMMASAVMAKEVIELLKTGANGEVRAKVSEDEPAFTVDAPDLVG